MRPPAPQSPQTPRRWKLIGPRGKPEWSEQPGTVGGHRAQKLYGTLDCPSALRAIAAGGYVSQRVFFRDEHDARSAGYRPCARCLPIEYARWKASAGDRAHLVEAARALPETPLGPEFFYDALPLTVADAIFSIGVRHETTAATVARMGAAGDLPGLFRASPDSPPADRWTASEAARMLAGAGADAGASSVFANRQRTSTGARGILKAEAVRQALELFGRSGVERLADLATMTPPQMETLEQAWRAIPGQTSGISWRYWLMLAGRESAIKPDRMVLRWIAKTLQRDVALDEAVALVQYTAATLGRPPRALDYQIWSWERQREAPTLERTPPAAPELAAVPAPAVLATSPLTGSGRVAPSRASRSASRAR